MPHTYVLLEVTSPVFREVETKLREAGYTHVFDEERGRLVIDMHGLALVEVKPESAGVQRLRVLVEELEALEREAPGALQEAVQERCARDPVFKQRWATFRALVHNAPVRLD